VAASGVANVRRSLWRERVRPLWEDLQWPLVAVLALVALALGMDGFRRHFDAVGDPRSPADLLYLALQLFTLESGSVSPPVNGELDVARLLAPGVAVYAAARAVAAVFRDQLQLLRARIASGHVVVCGLGERGVVLTKAFKDRGERVIAIERDEEAEGVQQCREHGVAVVVGDARDTATLRKARVGRAKYLVSVGGDDGVNAEVAVDAGELATRAGGGELQALVHVVDLTLCDLLRDSRTGAPSSDGYRVRFFNVFESGARAWLREHPPFENGYGGRPHLVVVGVGQMGTSLVIGAVRHWLTFHPQTAIGRVRGPRLTIVDRAASQKRDRLLLRHPLLEKFCELEARELEIASPEFEAADFLFPGKRYAPPTIYVCLDDDSLSLRAGLTLRRRLDMTAPVVVRMRQEAGLAALLAGNHASRVGNLNAFPVLDRTCAPEIILGRTREETIARAIHEEYVRDQASRADGGLANEAAVGWDDLDEGLKESNRRQADHAEAKLRAIGYRIAPLADGRAPPVEFSPDEVEVMARMEHDRWMAERLFAGWTYARGPKNLRRRTSPSLLPWPKLSDEAKELDRNTVRNLPAFLARAGFGVSRG
jgi:hypothetical protein